ncbi:MAG: hypothetical protein HY706_16220 [Candidatus Hydrogenedentes bacterium]|nr:hypothetical protein [Candidatus Hydrogenedentota bacterium]
MGLNVASVAKALQEHLYDYIGSAHDSDDLNRALKYGVQRLQAATIGAMHVTCSDESEREIVESFQQWFVRDLLPDFKFTGRSPFRIANLGARHEPGAVQLAEQHFTTPESRDSFKVLVVKINSHVSAEETVNGPVYGRMTRYDTSSFFCGALHALLDGTDGHYLRELAALFRAGGKDRVALLRDASHVATEYRALLAAAVNAGLQARRVLEEVQRFEPSSPTVFVILPCVTLNRHARDHELLCAVHVADCRAKKPETKSWGLSDDPSSIRVRHEGGVLHLENAKWAKENS